MNVNVEIDNKKLLKNIEKAKREIHEKFKKELITTALTDIETEAKMRLTERGHIVTGRLRASIHTEYQGNQGYNYSDNNGKSYNGSLKEPISNNLDVIVGTNVIYSCYIERLDAYLFPAFEKSKPGLQKRLRNIIDSL